MLALDLTPALIIKPKLNCIKHNQILNGEPSGCFSDRDCAHGMYCASDKTCRNPDSKYCHNNECGLGDGRTSA